jgi:hypothetical protein
LIANFDNDKIFNLNPTGNQASLVDSLITLDRYRYFIKNKMFCTFNFITDIIGRYNSENSENELEKKELYFNESFVIKMCCDKILEKYAKIIINLVDAKHIEEKIVMEGLNGFLVVENDDILLYSIFRFIARDGSHAIYQGKNN